MKASKGVSITGGRGNYQRRLVGTRRRPVESGCGVWNRDACTQFVFLLVPSKPIEQVVELIQVFLQQRVLSRVRPGHLHVLVMQ